MRENLFWAMAGTAAGMLLVVIVGVQSVEPAPAQPGLDACVSGSSEYVPRAWLLDAQAQRDSLYDLLWAARDTAAKYKEAR